MKNSEYKQWYDNETYEVKTGKNYGLKLACCSCGLIHSVIISKINDSNKVKVTIKEDKRASATYRRHHKDDLEFVGKKTYENICRKRSK